MPMTDLSALHHINFYTIDNNSDLPKGFFGQYSGPAEESDDFKNISVDDGPSKGLRRTADPLAALRDIYGRCVVAPLAINTPNYSNIAAKLDYASFQLLRGTTYCRVSKTEFHRHIKVAITMNQAPEEKCVEVYVDFDGWTHPSKRIQDFRLFRSDGTVVSTSPPVRSTPSVAPALPFNTKTLSAEGKDRYDRKHDDTGFVLGTTIATKFPAPSGSTDRYFYEMVPGNAILLADGTLFRNDPNVDAKQLSKLHVPLNDTSSSGIRRWCEYFEKTMIGSGAHFPLCTVAVAVAILTDSQWVTPLTTTFSSPCDIPSTNCPL